MALHSRSIVQTKFIHFCSSTHRDFARAKVVLSILEIETRTETEKDFTWAHGSYYGRWCHSEADEAEMETGPNFNFVGCMVILTLIVARPLASMPVELLIIRSRIPGADGDGFEGRAQSGPGELAVKGGYHGQC